LDNDFYTTILTRKSVRSYDQHSFNPADMARVELILKNTNPLIPGSKFSVLFKSREKGEDLVSILGAYGRFISPPYYLLPFEIGEEQSFVDLGYQTEQIAVQLWSKGIGSCFIGCLSRQEKVRMDFHLPDNARMAAFLAIGYPSEKFGIDSISKGAKSILGIRNRLALEDICYRDSFQHKFEPEGKWQAILEAARMSPSAVNAQPWRFLFRGNDLFIFSSQDHRKYLLPENRFYTLHDCGICMANMTMAMDSLGHQGKWSLLNESDAREIGLPTNLIPLAKLNIE
jgi:nitroreductase